MKKDVNAELSAARHAVPIGTRWAHYKGGIYEVVGHGFDTERQEVNAHYVRRGGPSFDAAAEAGVVFDRPIKMFAEVGRFREIR